MSIRYLFLFASLLVLLSLASCNKCLKAYDQAALYYNTGAQLSLQNTSTTLEDQPMSIAMNEVLRTAVSGSDSAFTYYQRALTAAHAFEGCKTQLEQQNKYGNALTIQSLAAWQVRDYERARSSREKALAAFESDPVEHTREEAIMASLPALINLLQFQDTLDHITRFANGEARELVDASPALRQTTYDRVRATYQKFVLDDQPGSPSVKRSQKTLLQNIETVDRENESFRRILAYALMRNLTQWTNANTQMDKIRRLLSITDSEEVDTISQQETAFRVNLGEWQPLIENTLPLGADDPMYRQWKRNMGI